MVDSKILDDGNCKFFFSEIQPKTKRTEELRQKKLQQEQEARELADLEARKKREIEEKKAREKADKEKRMHMQEMQRREEERRRREEEEQKNKLSGKLQNFITDLKRNETKSHEFLEGLEIGPVRMRLIGGNLESNKSLMSLSIIRNNLNDEEGITIAKSLVNNSTLKDLMLEGNNLGFKTAIEFGNLLKVNKTIKNINLDNNNLTNYDTTSDGIIQLANGLKQNDTLLSLSLLGNIMDEKALEAFHEMLRYKIDVYNQTIIKLDLSQNKKNKVEPQMDNEMPPSLRKQINILNNINDCLKRNESDQNALRYKEQLERKRMRFEEDQTRTHDMNGELETMEQIQIYERSKNRLEERNDYEATRGEDCEQKWRMDIEKAKQLQETRALESKKKKGKKKK